MPTSNRKYAKDSGRSSADHRIWIMLFISLLCEAIISPALVSAEPRCTAATTCLEDQELWARHNCSSDFRSWFRSYFRLKESDWDEGWGWKQCTPTKPFGKMMNAAFLLTYGIEPWETYPPEWYLFGLSSWTAENATTESDHAGTGFEINPDPRAYEPAVFYQTNYDFHLVGAGLSGDLIYYRGGQTPNDWVGRNITRYYIPYAQRPDYRLIHHPVHVSDGVYDYFFGVTLEYDVVCYQRSVLGGLWYASKLTKDLPNRFNLKSLRRLVGVFNGSAVYAFGVNREGHLIRYRSGEVIDITANVPNGDSQFRISGHLRISSHASELHLIGLNPDGDLIHYHQSPAGLWTAKNITKGWGNNYRLSNSAPPALIQNGDGSNEIFGISRESNLIRIFRDSSGAWSIRDVTLSLPYHGIPYRLATSYAVCAYRAGGATHIFGLNSDSEVVHYTLGEWVWTAENITKDRPNIGAHFRASLSPVAFSGPADSQHVYVRGLYGQLYHYYRAPNHPWSAEDITTRVNIGIDYNFVTAPIVVTGPAASQHVFALNTRGELAHYFTSGQAHAWHGNADYVWLAAGNVHDFHYEPRDKWENIVAEAQGGFWQTDMVKMNCPAFHGDFMEGGPEGRAGAMLHEAIHVIYWRWEHQEHPVYGGDADPWLYHGVNDYPPGSINLDRKHSMYQVQVEYLSDLAEFPAKWVPLNIPLAAQSLAEIYIYCITDPPDWRPGEPRPF